MFKLGQEIFDERKYCKLGWLLQYAWSCFVYLMNKVKKETKLNECLEIELDDYVTCQREKT